MQNIGADLLKKVIEIHHGGHAGFSHCVRVARPGPTSASWDGVVHVFNLTGHPLAKRAFAWASPIAGSGAPRFFAVLQQGRIASAADAAKAAAIAVQNSGSSLAARRVATPPPALPNHLLNS